MPMNTAQYNHLFSFIWNIANDVLVHAFEKGEYKKIIMPMTVLRRLDILLEPTKDAVLERKAQLDAANISNQDISKYLDMGLGAIYEVRITRITPDVHPEQQVEVVVNILNQNG